MKRDYSEQQIDIHWEKSIERPFPKDGRYLVGVNVYMCVCVYAASAANIKSNTSNYADSAQFQCL